MKQSSHPAHGVVIEMGGVDYTMRGTFRIACQIEEKYGDIAEFGQSIIAGEHSISDLANFMGLLLPDAPRDAIEAHFDEVGTTGVRIEICSMFAQIIRGFRVLSAEAEKSGTGENPPQTAGQKKRGWPKGTPRGPRTQRDASHGETSLPEPQSSASDQPSSGQLPLTNSPAFGEQPVDLLNGAATTTSSPISGPSQIIA